MKISDAKLAEVGDRGFTVVPGFLDAETLAEARAALWSVHPKPEDYFADPSKYRQYSDSQFAGITNFPYEDWALSRLPVYPDLIDAMERLLSTDDIEVYKIELWAKYAGAVDYAQPHHRDFGTTAWSCRALTAPIPNTPPSSCCRTSRRWTARPRSCRLSTPGTCR